MDWQLTFNSRRSFSLHFDAVRHDLVGENEANDVPGDELPLHSTLLHDSESLLKLLEEEIECKSKMVVLKCCMAHWRLIVDLGYCHWPLLIPITQATPVFI